MRSCHRFGLVVPLEQMCPSGVASVPLGVVFLLRLFPFFLKGWCVVSLCVLFCGSRSFSSREAVERAVRSLPADALVVSGGASGPDSWAVEAARSRGLSVRVFPAEWRRFGRSAGMRRNRLMLSFLLSLRSSGWRVGVLAFWDGSSPGTAGMLRLALRARVALRVVSPAGNTHDCTEDGYSRNKWRAETIMILLTRATPKDLSRTHSSIN